jgi:NAD(P)-dependent dehydrogenase (short-subunit alcohol dehydrogenase family)
VRQPSADVVLVTGCSSGIGRATCARLARTGAIVYGGSRTHCAPERWAYIPLDVTQADGVRAFVAEVLRREGRISALVSCAGIGLAGALEDTADDEARHHFETNLFGTTRMVRAVLPTMRKQGSGKIIIIGSIGGLIGLPYVGYYSAAKFALDGLVQALRGEIAQFGVQATVLHPGDFHTSFGRRRIFAAAAAHSPYAQEFHKMLAFYALKEDGAPMPDAVAARIARLLSQRRLPARVVVGSPLERLGVLGKAILPGRPFEYLFRKAYSP